MKRLPLPLILILFSVSTFAQTFSSEVQINNALLAAPEEQREGAKVYGYNDQNELVVLREGSGDLICISDNPNEEGVNIACYHKSLEPFMARGRELRAAGTVRMEIFNIREE